MKMLQFLFHLGVLNCVFPVIIWLSYIFLILPLVAAYKKNDNISWIIFTFIYNTAINLYWVISVRFLIEGEIQNELNLSTFLMAVIGFFPVFGLSFSMSKPNNNGEPEDEKKEMPFFFVQILSLLLLFIVYIASFFNSYIIINQFFGALVYPFVMFTNWLLTIPLLGFFIKISGFFFTFNLIIQGIIFLFLIPKFIVYFKEKAGSPNDPPH